MQVSLYPNTFYYFRCLSRCAWWLRVHFSAGIREHQGHMCQSLQGHYNFGLYSKPPDTFYSKGCTGKGLILRSWKCAKLTPTHHTLGWRICKALEIKSLEQSGVRVTPHTLSVFLNHFSIFKNACVCHLQEGEYIYIPLPTSYC